MKSFHFNGENLPSDTNIARSEVAQRLMLSEELLNICALL